MLLVAFTLFRPGFWLDQVSDPYEAMEPAQIFEVAQSIPEDGTLRLVFEYENFDSGDLEQRTVLVPLGPAGDGETRLRDNAGIELLANDEGQWVVDNVGFGSWAEKERIDFDWIVLTVEREADRIAKEVFYLPALLLLLLVIMLQRRRTDVPPF